MLEIADGTLVSFTQEFRFLKRREGIELVNQLAMRRARTEVEDLVTYGVEVDIDKENLFLQMSDMGTCFFESIALATDIPTDQEMLFKIDEQELPVGTDLCQHMINQINSLMSGISPQSEDAMPDYFVVTRREIHWGTQKRWLRFFSVKDIGPLRLTFAATIREQ